jgi:hypothetical protein
MRKYFNACKTFKPLAQKVKNSGWLHPALIRKNEIKLSIGKGMEKMKSIFMASFRNFQHGISCQSHLKRVSSIANIARH